MIPTNLSASLRTAHRKLLEDLGVLSQEVAGECPLGLRERLRKTKRDLREHFRLEEQSGYLETVRRQDPGLESTLNRLLQEHEELCQSLDEILARIEKPDGDPVAARDAIQAWVHDVRGHEVRENKLIQDAFAHDLGAGD